MRRPFKNLIHPRFRHGKFQKHPNEPDHNKRPGGPQHAQRRIQMHQLDHFERLQNHAYKYKKQHSRVKLTPSVFEIGLFAGNESLCVDFGEHFLRKHHDAS